MAKKKKKILGKEDAEPFSSPFADLGQLRESLPSQPDVAVAPEVKAEEALFADRVLITKERKGRGGKTVTLVEGIAVKGEKRRSLVRELRSTLGTSGKMEDDVLVLGGDQRERLRAWLQAKGAGKIVVGN